MPFNEDGFEVIENIVAEAAISSIIKELDDKGAQMSGAGIRNAEKKFISVKDLVESPNLIAKASGYLTGTPQLVRAIVFIKSTENNWLVSWHQDKTVAISSRYEVDGWGPWSEKDGVLHVQPPVEVLNQMVTFRIHLDDSTKENGCLRLLAKSHQMGVMSQEQIDNYTRDVAPVYCLAPRGSALVMRPHILHSSSKALAERPRRVLHVEYSFYQLPSGVQWA